jgi:hypothetical protein
MASDFVKRLDDVVRQELSVLGRDYSDVIVAIEEGRGSEGAVVRFRPPYDDLSVDEPESDVTDEAFSARIGRRLRTILEAPERPPSPD